MLVIGTLAVVSATLDYPNQLTIKYKESIDAWITFLDFSLWENLSVNATIYVKHDDGTLPRVQRKAPLQLLPITSPRNDTPTNTDVYEYGTYREVYFNVNLPPDMIPKTNFMSAPEVKVVFTFQPRTEDHIVSTSETDFLPLASLIKTRVAHGVNSCLMGAQGVYDSLSQMCVEYESLSSLCVQVSLETNGTVNFFRNEVGDYGCALFDNHMGATYSRVPVVGTNTMDVVIPVLNFTDLGITVRSNRDPYLIAAQFEDDMAFGLSSFSSMVIGIIFLLIGVLTCIQPLIAFRRTCIKAGAELTHVRSSYYSVVVNQGEEEMSTTSSGTSPGDMELTRSYSTWFP